MEPPVLIGDVQVYGLLLTQFYAIVLDIYALTRMFKPFKHDPYQPRDQRFVIVYAGFEHTKNLAEVLKQLDFELTVSIITEKANSRCLDLTGIDV